MTDMRDNNHPHIHSITFHDAGIEIAYAEPRDIETMGETGVLRTRIVMCPAKPIEAEMGDLLDSVYEILDRILVIERNPAPPSAYRR